VRLRSAFAAAAVVACAVGVAAVVFVATARATLTGNVDAAATQRAAEVVAAIRTGDSTRLEQNLQPSAGEQTVVQIVNNAGVVVAASAAIAGEPPLTPMRPSAGQSQWEERALPIAAEDPFRILAVGVATDDGSRVVVVAQSLRPVNESTEVVTQVLAAGMPILVLIVGAATFVFVGRSLRPVEAIRRRVATITGRDLHARVPVPADRDEVAALAETMNAMLDRLEAAAGAQRRFVADASHELRSPLATIQVGLDLLAARATTGQPQVQRLQAETHRLGRLVADLLLLARFDEHGLTLRRDDVDLDDLAYTQRDRLAAQHPDLRVLTRISPVRVRGDADQLERALRNLVDNAVRHAREEVTMAAWADGEGAHLLVADDGPGVAPDDRGRIFDRFVRLDDSRTRSDGGSGLGLAITREIIAGHGGSITVADAVPGFAHGGGAVFHIRLPLETSPALSAPPHPEIGGDAG
jgi:signal transduction histidine kinase